MKFTVWNRELDFDIRTKNITYKNMSFSPDIRTYAQMKDLYNIWPESEKLGDDFWMYYMYRWVCFSPEDKQVFEKNHIRYDVTILVPRIIKEEYNKTYGYFHPANKAWKKYEEIYEVLEWNAIYLQQNDNETFYTSTIPWDKVVMKEWFGHVTINSSSTEYLMMANLIDDSFDSEYEKYKEFKWANYLYTDGGWEINKNYKNKLEIKENYDKFEEVMNIYDEFIADPKKFKFLH